MAEFVWNEDLGVLEAVAELEGEWGTDVASIAALLERDAERVGPAVRRLWDDDYLIASDASTYEGFDAISVRLLGKGRRAIGQWPSEQAVFERLIELLAERADREPDEQRREALDRAKDGLQAAGASAVGSVLATLWRHMAGI